VSVSKTGENTYLITIPEFMVIGYDEPKFEGRRRGRRHLQLGHPDIDKVDMVNEVFNEAAHRSSTSRSTGPARGSG
jgi:hypothetical protein